MHVLLENNYIVAGPYQYNQRKFQAILLDDYELQQSLPSKIDAPLTINESLTLAPVVNTTYSSDFNPKVQQLVGPYPTLTEAGVDLHYDVILRDIVNVKNEIKDAIKAARQEKEFSGVEVVVNGVAVLAPTDRESRAILAQALQLNAFDKNWKFGETWLVLDQASLVLVISAILAHVQAAFDWEKSKIDALELVSDVLLLADFEVVPVAAV